MKEKGEALLETVLIAPIILMIGLFATEFGAVAITRSQLSESVRSTINKELLSMESSDLVGDGRTLELSIKRNLMALPNLDPNKPIEVEVVLLAANEVFVNELPFLAIDKSTISKNRPQEFEIRVKVQSKGLFNSHLELPALVDVVRYRLRG